MRGEGIRSGPGAEDEDEALRAAVNSEAEIRGGECALGREEKKLAMIGAMAGERGVSTCRKMGE